MSFKFDFFPDEEGDEDTEVSGDVSETCGICESEQIFVHERHFREYKDINVDRFTFLPYRPFYEWKTKSDDTDDKPISEDVDEDEHGLVRYLLDKDADDGNSDLVPNVYEGGHKVWECSLDLCEYLSEEEISLEGLKVLENQDVLENRTIPNFIINTPDDTDASHVVCQFWAGDWSKFTQRMTEQKYSYDVILTSETIYSAENYQKLHECLESLLDTRGVIYLSAKSYYFGVGGGTQQFREFVEKKNIFTIESVKTVDACLKREILKMTFKIR